MKLKKIRDNKWFKIFSNKYLLVTISFVVWMLFLDSNSWLIHHELDNEIEDLEKNKQYYLNEIAKDKAIIEKLDDSLELEKFARREYFMKRENEEIFIIEHQKE
ncbi:FtsB family cell division protein [Salinimicrobium gaetbulicola]|uniref:Septum formation initiator family protein n=1 Tax=Salinimicrobium gaetbulicola TaxID=999702 RepID=A0ABW3IE32_9FLAO